MTTSNYHLMPCEQIASLVEMIPILHKLNLLNTINTEQIQELHGMYISLFNSSMVGDLDDGS